MAKIVAGVCTSHVPAIGAALDLGKTEEPYWKRVFSGYERSKRWIEEVKPDVCIVVFNDHATAFSVDVVPTFALGCAEEFIPADEGWGPRPVPVVKGHPELAAQSSIRWTGNIHNLAFAIPIHQNRRADRFVTRHKLAITFCSGRFENSTRLTSQE